jgi:hypothetical protein
MRVARPQQRHVTAVDLAMSLVPYVRCHKQHIQEEKEPDDTRSPGTASSNPRVHAMEVVLVSQLGLEVGNALPQLLGRFGSRERFTHAASSRRF